MKLNISSDARLLIVLLIIIAAIAGIFGRNQPDSETGFQLPKRTTYSTKPFGLKGIYDTLKKLGYHTSRQINPISSEMESGIFILLDPEIPLSTDEWQYLRNWTKRGNLLIISADQDVAVEMVNSSKISIARPTYPSFLAKGVKFLAIPSNSSVDEEKWTFAGSTPSYTKLTKSKHHKVDTSQERFPLMPLFTSEAGTTVAIAKCGRGTVLQLCSGAMLSNGSIASGDNLIMLLNALKPRSPQMEPTVTFDEFHHGYGNAPGIATLLDKSAKLGLSQLFLAFLLLVFAVSRRFGRPILLTEGQRQRSEYLYSMSTLLRRAGATSAVKEVLDKKFIEDMAHYYGLPPTSSTDTILQTARQRNTPGFDTLSQLVTPRESSASNENSLLSLTVRRHRYRKELMNKK